MKRNFRVLGGRLLFAFIVVLMAGTVLVSSAQAQVPTVPDVPTDLASTGFGETNISLSWTAPADGGDPITNYLVEYRLVETSDPWIIESTPDSSATYTVSALATTTAYEFRVSALNGLGLGATSSVIIATTAPSVVYVDDDYTSDPDGAGGHTWGYDAFANIQDGLDIIAEGGTVNVTAGTYSENININKQLTLLGDIGDDDIGAGPDAPVISDSVGNNRTVNISASGVTFRGFIVENNGSSYPAVRIATDITSTTIKNNDLRNGSNGATLSPGSQDNLITKNKIYDNYRGIFINGSISNTISVNEIYNSGENGIEVVLNKSAGDNNINNNNIHDNSGNGVRFGSNLDTSAGAISVDSNIINSNDLAGVRIEGGTSDISITGNTIINNGTVPMEATGIHIISALGNSAHNNIISNDKDDEGINNEDGDNIFDASENYWGGANGPYSDVNNPAGNASSSIVGNVKFRPYYTDEARTTLSTVAVDPSNIGDLFGNGGSFSVPDGETPTDATQVNVDEAITISVATGAGTSSVALPVGTVITKTGGGTFDASDLTAAGTAISGLSGFASGQVVEGAFEWGLPSLGLTFSSPITINIYVGTALNGQTLTIYRSLSQTNGWETSGIVAPGTCVVSAGVCSFQTTKASYFAATKSVAVSSGSSARGGSSIISMVTVPPVATSTAIKAFTFIRNLTIGSQGDDVRVLQMFLNASGFLVAKTGAGSLGSETPYFGALTRTALIKFQEAHSAEILVPLGLSKGTGYFGLATRSFIGKK